MIKLEENYSLNSGVPDPIQNLNSNIQLPFEQGALPSSWRHYVKQGHLPSLKVELTYDGLLLSISSGAALHGIIAKRYAQNFVPWIRISYIACTSLSAAAILINATNEYRLLRERRRTPQNLIPYSLEQRPLQLLLEDLGVLFISGVSSIALATAAWRYSSEWPELYQISFTVAMEIINTLLHLLPVFHVVFNHPVYGLPLQLIRKPYHAIRRCLLTEEERDQKDLLAFKIQKAGELERRLILSVNRASNAYILHLFKWQGFSVNPFKSFAYVKQSKLKEKSPVQMELDEFVKLAPPIEQAPTTPGSRIGELLQMFIYALGAVWVVSSNLGYLADPLSTLMGSMNPGIAITISVGAIYFLGVLLAHMGGSSFQADTTYVYQTVQCKKDSPSQEVKLEARVSTKFSTLCALGTLYAAPFASGSAIQLAIDHFGGTVLEAPLIWAARTGVAYFTITAVNKLVKDYLIKYGSYIQCLSNRSMMELQRRLDHWKRHIPSDPDALVTSLKDDYDPLDLPHLIGMNQSQFSDFVDFPVRYQEHKRTQAQSTSWFGIFPWKRKGAEDLTPLLQSTSGNSLK